jgi:hypothetical protein
VERLRSLDPEKRRHLEERLGLLQRARLDPSELAARLRGFQGLPPGEKRVIERRQRVARALAFVAWGDLPEDARAAAAGPRAGRGAFEAAFFKALGKAAVERAAKDGSALAFVPSERMPEELRKKIDRMRAEAKDAKGLRRLAETVVVVRGLEVLEAAGEPAAGGDARALEAWLAGVGARLKDAFQPSFDETVAEFAKAAREGPAAWAALLQRHLAPDATPERARRLEALGLAFRLEAMNAELASRPEMTAHADALLAWVLGRALGVSAEEVARLPARTEPERRREAFATLLRGHDVPVKDLRPWHRGGRGPGR